VVLPTITLQPVEVMTSSHDEDGRLAFADEQLVAVLVRLDDAVHEDERGSWFLEVGFSPCSRSIQPVFGSLEEAQAWVQEQVRIYRVRSASHSGHSPPQDAL
jgi:hypothetical protein